MRDFWGHDLDLLGPCNVIDYVITGLTVWGFLQMDNLNQTSISTIVEIASFKILGS